MSINHAAYLVETGKALEVREAPYPSPEPGTLVVKNHAIAINPVDWKLQGYDFLGLQYPFILGTDVAGEVVEIGSGVTGFTKGQRVIAHATSLANKDSRFSGFQEYTIVHATVAATLPSYISFEEGVVVPMAFNTAACGLYEKSYLDFPYPSESPKPTGQTLLVWGASSSVGVSVIQLARASGFEVIATASPRNHELVKKLGASQIFDYNSPTVVDDIVAASQGREIAGAYDTISEPDTQRTTAEILTKTNAANKFLVTTLTPVEGLPSEISAKVAWASLPQSSEVGPAVWAKYLTGALESGHFKPAPAPLVVGTGLEYVQAALEKNKAGVSAAKVVVTL